ncbi:lysophospholipid acyltransferase family protein [Clostridium sp. BJN0001]|uniref:lysophospholipid acyltransferase family protein n=1 Tax=Clostridium sp. BJN0001 TaxID=2930219 RepID=UPI001FD3BE82|nr:lysophospholipid acyltransferase family protein [Clostridium sp. BJN0001]
MIRNIIFFPLLLLSLVLVSIPIPLIKYYERKGLNEKKLKFVHKYTSKWANFVIRITGAEVTVKGLENIPKNQTILFVANHQSDFDIPLLISSIDVLKGFIAKKEMETWPIISTWMKLLNCVFMDRSNLRQSAHSIMQGVTNLKNGYSMVIFPEGTRSKGGPVGDFKGGSFKLATKSKCPIVPITINGSSNLFEGNNNKIHSAKVNLIIHAPIYVTNLSKEEEENLKITVRNTIISGM